MPDLKKYCEIDFSFNSFLDSNQNEITLKRYFIGTKTFFSTSQIKNYLNTNFLEKVKTEGNIKWGKRVYLCF